MTPEQESLASIAERLWTWAQRIVAPIIAGLLLVTGVLLQSVWASMQETEKRVGRLEIEEARSSGSVLTVQEWSQHKAGMDARHNLLDLRVTKQEESVSYIKESLRRIEEALNQIAR